MAQAKVLELKQIERVLDHIDETCLYPVRDKLIVCLSFFQGMRAKEIAYLDFHNVTDANGAIADQIFVAKNTTKGANTYGRQRWIPMHPLVRDLIEEYAANTETPEGRVFINQYGFPMTPDAVRKQIAHIYNRMGFQGASSHSGRRSFITQAARLAGANGCSLKDVQQLAGHANLSTTEIYIDASPRQVDLVAALWVDRDGANTAAVQPEPRKGCRGRPQRKPSRFVRNEAPKKRRTRADYMRRPVGDRWVSILKEPARDPGNSVLDR